MQDLYPNLPGILTEFKDGGLVLRNDPNPPATESILILGTAVDGPTMEPVAIDAESVELLFGKALNANGTSNGSTLVKAFEEAYQAGNRDIRLMRVTGTKAKALIKAASTTFNNDKAHDEVLGLAQGNVEVTFQLNQEVIDLDSVAVAASGVDLVASQFEVTQGSAGTKATVKVLADQVNAGAEIFITYSYGTDTITTVTENGFTNDEGVLENYVALGADKVFTLAHTPKSGSLTIYANGAPLAKEAFNVSGLTVTLKAGYARLGTSIDASYLFVETVTESPEVTLEAVYGGYLYNEGLVEVKNITDSTGVVIGKEVVITKPTSKKAQITEQPMTFSSLDFPNLGVLIQAINTYPQNNVVRLSTARRFEEISTTALQVQAPTAFTGGEDGVQVTKQQMFEALGGKRDVNGLLVEPGAYQLLENYSVDNIAVYGVYADDELAGRYDNFAYQLALACAVISHRGTATHGIIATSSPEETGLKAVAEHYDHLMAQDLAFFMKDTAGNNILDSDGNAIDLGRYISIVAGPDVVLNSGRFGVYANNTPTVYGGLVSSLAVQSAPTNKTVPGVYGTRFNFSNAQLNGLTGKGYVTYRSKGNGDTVVVVDAMTAAQPGSDYKRLVTYRVVKEAVNEVRDVADPYIGEPNETAQQNAMSAAIAKRLDAMVEAGAIVDYDFQIVATAEMQLLGQAQIELTIVPPMELRQITVVVSLSTGI